MDTNDLFVRAYIFNPKSKEPAVNGCSSYSDDSKSDNQKDNAKWTRVNTKFLNHYFKLLRY